MLRMYLFALASRVIDLARTANRSRCFASLLRGQKMGPFRSVHGFTGRREKAVSTRMTLSHCNMRGRKTGGVTLC